MSARVLSGDSLESTGVTARRLGGEQWTTAPMSPMRADSRVFVSGSCPHSVSQPARPGRPRRLIPPCVLGGEDVGGLAWSGFFYLSRGFTTQHFAMFYFLFDYFSKLIKPSVKFTIQRVCHPPLTQSPLAPSTPPSARVYFIHSDIMRTVIFSKSLLNKKKSLCLSLIYFILVCFTSHHFQHKTFVKNHSASHLIHTRAALGRISIFYL